MPTPPRPSAAMLRALDQLTILKEEHKHALPGNVASSLHVAICELERATADQLLRETRRLQTNDEASE